MKSKLKIPLMMITTVDVVSFISKCHHSQKRQTTAGSNEPNMPAVADNSTKLIWMSLQKTCPVVKLPRPFAKAVLVLVSFFKRLTPQLSESSKRHIRFQWFETQMFPFLSVWENLKLQKHVSCVFFFTQPFHNLQSCQKLPKNQASTFCTKTGRWTKHKLSCMKFSESLLGRNLSKCQN